MRLYCCCKRCKSEIVCAMNYSDRGEMTMYLGRDISLTCDVCCQKQNYHPNDFTVECRKSILYTALVVFLIAASIMVFFAYRFYSNHNHYFQTQSLLVLFKKTAHVMLLPFVLFGLIIGFE